MWKILVSIFGGVVGEAVAEYDRMEEEMEANSRECNETFVNVCDLNPKMGDLIEIHGNPCYSHWVLYVGNDNVIQLCRQEGNESYEVMMTALKDVAKGSKCRINNLDKAAHDRGLVARDVNDIISSAYSKLSQTIEYRLYEYNCEHFVTECRYGQGFSLQAEAAKREPIIKQLGPGVEKGLNVSNLSYIK